MNKTILVICFICLAYVSNATFAQNTPLRIKLKQGEWEFTSYADIIRCTFAPLNYNKNEQISNAVIIKPSGSINKNKFAVSADMVSVVLSDKRLTFSYVDSAGYKGFRFNLDSGEQIFGAGERAVPMNRRGYRLNLYNQPNYGYGAGAENLNYSVPFITSTKGYGIFFDNPSRGHLDIGKTNHTILEYGTISGELTFYIIPGKTVSSVLSGFHRLTGTQPLPARWVFGNLMSRFGYRSEAQLMNILQSMEDEKIAVDAVILDLFWFGDSIKGTMGNLDWVNRKAWPDPAAMISKLKTKGIKTVLITEPYLLNTTRNYIPSRKYHAVDSSGAPYLIKDFYFGQAGLLDIFRKDAQDWFWSKYKMQIPKGVAGWWGDLGEPERHPADLMHNLNDLGHKRLFTADEVHNIYGHYWDKMLYDKYAKEYPSVRLFNLNRSGYAGSARYGVFPWSGDVGRNWSGLQAQLPVMLGMSISGMPYVHADAGGFALGEGDPELYTRWMQFAAFTPVLRPHGTALGDLEPSVKDIPSEAALYDEPYKSIVRNYIRLRYYLLPYNYTLGYQQAKYGKALVRPMFYEKADTNTLRAAEQFMWGDHILVAPVLEKNAVSKKLYLPEGMWYNFHTDSIVAGEQWITDSVDLRNIPIYVRSGSFIPLFAEKGIKNTEQYKGDKITIKYYPSEKPSTYTLFDDDGKTNNTLRTGNYKLIEFEGKEIENKIYITIKGQKYAGKPKEFKIVLPDNYRVSWNVNGSDSYSDKEKGLVELLYNGNPYKIILTINQR